MAYDFEKERNEAIARQGRNFALPEIGVWLIFLVEG